MVSKRKIIMMVVVSLLIIFGATTQAFANEGIGAKVLAGEFGNRIDLFPCLFSSPCEITVSSSESTYLNHGWFFYREELAESQPAKFELFINGEEIQLQRFSIAYENGLSFWFYTIFEPGSLPVGTHTITGVWSMKGETTENATATLYVTP